MSIGGSRVANDQNREMFSSLFIAKQISTTSQGFTGVGFDAYPLKLPLWRRNGVAQPRVTAALGESKGTGRSGTIRVGHGFENE